MFAEILRITPVTFMPTRFDERIMFPQVLIRISSGSYSREAKSSGIMYNQPTFDESMDFDHREKGNIDIELFDYNTFSIIGRGFISHASLVECGGNLHEWIPLELGGIEVGQLLLGITVSLGKASRKVDSDFREKLGNRGIENIPRESGVIGEEN